MKRKNLIVAALIAAQFALAKEYVLVVRGKGQTTSGQTEIMPTGGDGQTDTLQIKPGKNVNSIYVTLHNEEGQIVQHEVVPTEVGSMVELSSEEFFDQPFLLIRDDKGNIFIED